MSRNFLAFLLPVSGTAWRMPQRLPVGMHPSIHMSAVDVEPSRWAVFRDAEGVPQLRASSSVYSESLEMVTIERTPERPGLGIALVEYGVVEDKNFGSAALVLISELAPDSNAALASSAPLLPGDALVYVGAPGAAAKGEALRVEGKTYDDTVAAIGSLPAGPVELYVKRLRVRAKATVNLQFPQGEGRKDEFLVLYAGANLRRSILSHGIVLNDPLARRFDAGIGTGDCGGEGVQPHIHHACHYPRCRHRKAQCGSTPHPLTPPPPAATAAGCCCTCAVDISSGMEALTAPKTQEKQMLSRFPRWRLACRARVVDIQEDVVINIKVQPRGFDGFYSDAECDVDGQPLKRNKP